MGALDAGTRAADAAASAPAVRSARLHAFSDAVFALGSPLFVVTLEVPTGVLLQRLLLEPASAREEG